MASPILALRLGLPVVLRRIELPVLPRHLKFEPFHHRVHDSVDARRDDLPRVLDGDRAQGVGLRRNGSTGLERPLNERFVFCQGISVDGHMLVLVVQDDLIGAGTFRILSTHIDVHP